MARTTLRHRIDRTHGTAGQVVAPTGRSLAVGIAALMLALAGCGTGGGDPTESPTEPSGTSTSISPSPTTSEPASPSAEPSETDGGPSTPASPGPEGAELPSAELERWDHQDGPRPMEDLFHLSCLHAVDGEDIPETTGGADEIAAWSVQGNVALTDGWKLCPTQVYESIAVPAVFGVETEGGPGEVHQLRFTDPSGKVIGGFSAEVPDQGPASAEIAEAVEVTELEASPVTDETRYVRTLVVDTPDGPKLLVDQVSAPAGTDPVSLEVWDLATGPGTRALVYAAIPLESLDQGAEVASSDLAAVLQSMVGSFEPSVQ